MKSNNIISISFYCLLIFCLILSVVNISHAIEAKVLASNITSNTTTSVPYKSTIAPGYKTVVGVVSCSSGSCTQTQAIYGDIDSDSANGILLCTITLSGTTVASDSCPPFIASFPYYYIVTTATTGTYASGTVYLYY